MSASAAPGTNHLFLVLYDPTKGIARAGVRVCVCVCVFCCLGYRREQPDKRHMRSIRSDYVDESGRVKFVPGTYEGIHIPYVGYKD